jgi:hypothetical protein
MGFIGGLAFVACFCFLSCRLHESSHSLMNSGAEVQRNAMVVFDDRGYKHQNEDHWLH